jgi:hypothetical protein
MNVNVMGCWQNRAAGVVMAYFPLYSCLIWGGFILNFPAPAFK